MSDENTTYLCYDIRGIQQFIFAIPRLKYIIGASSLIDEFDRETSGKIAEQANVTRIYAGGGRGIFACSSKKAEDDLREAVIREAHKIGLDVRIGASESIIKAGDAATELYSCPPDSLEGEPCTASGLFPVKPGTGKGYKDDKGGVHPIVWKRRDAAKKDRIGNHLLDSLREMYPKSDRRNYPWDEPNEVEFLSNVSPDDDDLDKQERETARLGARSLGGRNRWAVVVMDGNDIGSQHRNAPKDPKDPEKYSKWLEKMSAALDQTTREAVASAVGKVLLEWAGTDDARMAQEGTRIILPIRPLLVGGDDVVLLCHTGYAIELARQISLEFNRLSKTRKLSDHEGSEKLWVGTGGALTISAGILFCGITLPLASAIDYAHELMSSAKKRGRDDGRANAPAPACLDWESITEGAIDTPAARRQRELTFIDGDIDGDVVKELRINLTRRPYTFEEFEKLEEQKQELAKLPGALRHELMQALRRGTYERSLFLSRIHKNHPALSDGLCWDPMKFQEILKQGGGSGEGSGLWKISKDKDGPVTACTSVVDMALLLEEGARLDTRTADKEAR